MKADLSFRARVWLVAAMALAGALASFVRPPLKQPAEYHRFADQRAVFGVPSFSNVASNAAFLLMWLFPARYTRGAGVLWVVPWYAVAKVAEVLDAWIFGVAGWISGHTVKHLLAALGICCLARMLVRRSPSPALPTPS